MNALVTGACGLIGSAITKLLLENNWNVFGVDNNNRSVFFGENGSTNKIASQLTAHKNYSHFNCDIADKNQIDHIMSQVKPALVVHTAAQPSHDAARDIVFLDADTNIIGTLSVLEATRRHSGDAVFVHLSTNKVYGDHPNRIPIVELETRFDYDIQYKAGVNESMQIDDGIHSVFGVSKLAADAYVVEYGKNFGLKTVTLRCGCLTGVNHASVELHGFLSYIVKCAVKQKQYKIFGYKGKQVRDQLDATDVANLIYTLFNNPVAPGSIFNVGGGRKNSASILETIKLIKEFGFDLQYEYIDQSRVGDHICYITDNSKIQKSVNWEPKISIQQMIKNIIDENM